MKQKEVKKYLTWLFHLIKKHPHKFKIKKLKGRNTGNYVEEGKKFYFEIDLTKDIVPSLIHEALHHWYPNIAHKLIYKMEKQITKSLSLKQCREIIKRLAKIL